MNLETADLKVSSVNLLLLCEHTATGLSFKNKLQKAVKSSKIATVFFDVFASNFIRFHRNEKPGTFNKAGICTLIEGRRHTFQSVHSAVNNLLYESTL